MADSVNAHRWPGPHAASGSHPASVVIDRIVELGVDRASLWSSISTAEGWREWLVNAGRFDGVFAGMPVGIVVDGDVVREVRIDRVEDGRSIGFSWWERADPSMVSHVTLEILESDLDVGSDTGSTLAIREELIGADESVATASAVAERVVEARLAWEVRVGSLWACTVAAALV